uniref:Protein kinase domain-containing protein n=1 Tax=Panagrellus redivivus TaxID=6233 RepID=A0A7E4WD63_PANRE
MMNPIHEQNALQLPGRNRVKLRMCNLRLHSSGVFSNVYRGTLLEPEPVKEVAVKKTWPEKMDDHRNIELILLLALSREKHKNIVQVLFTFQTISDRKDKRICESMVFDFMPQTFSSAIPDIFGPPMNIVDCKLYTWQLFNGLYFLLRKRICHRDIKPQNLLVDPESGILKIGDFGSAKHMANVIRSTPYQVTRFYRPPELLLDSDQYTCLVDVWSAGCCVGEMLRGEVLFPGRDGKHQLKLIVQALGSPSDADVAAMRTPMRLEGERVAGKGLSSLLPKATTEFVTFLGRILQYTPKSRLCGRELLLDPFFSDILTPGKKRTNGRLISDVISPEELLDLKVGRKNRKKPSTKDANGNPQTPIVPSPMADTATAVQIPRKSFASVSEEGGGAKKASPPPMVASAGPKKPSAEKTTSLEDTKNPQNRRKSSLRRKSCGPAAGSKASSRIPCKTAAPIANELPPSTATTQASNVGSKEK